MHSDLRGQRPRWMEEARRACYRIPTRRTKSYRVSRSIRMERREHLVFGYWFGFSADRRCSPPLSLEGHCDLGIPASIIPRDLERSFIFQSSAERGNVGMP